MEDKILDGKLVAKSLRQQQEQNVQKLLRKGVQPKLTVVLVGDDPASKVYVGMKEKACARLGIQSNTLRLASDIPEQELLGYIHKLNHDPENHGILVQLPLPSHIDEEQVLLKINPLKDVDCFHPQNVGLLVSGNPYVAPCTPAGIMEILKYYKISTEGKHVVVVGRSNIVGKPMANLLMQKNDQANATVTVVHSRSINMESHIKSADIVIAAMGRAHFINHFHLKKGSVVVDVGINRVEADNEKGYKLVGDVHFEDVLDTVAAITPVPGGVGPMTIAMLMQNTIKVAAWQNGILLD